jgi:hypothetical protein
MYSQILCKQFNAPQLEKDFLNLFHHELSRLDWSKWDNIDPTQLSQIAACTAEPPVLIKRTSVSATDLQAQLKIDNLLSIDSHTFVRQIITSLSWKIIFDQVSQMHEHQRSRFCADFITIIIQLNMFPSFGQESDVEQFVEFTQKRLLPLIISENLRSYIAVNDCVNVLKRCTTMILAHLQQSGTRVNITERNVEVLFTLLQGIAKQDPIQSEHETQDSHLSYVYEQHGFEYSVTLNPELLAFHTSGDQSFNDQAPVISVQGEERAAYHLQNYITFLFHTIATTVQSQQKKTDKRQSKRADALIDYLIKNKETLFTWILDMMIVRIKNKNTVEQDPLTMNILSQVLQIFNYTSGEFEDLSRTYLRYLLGSKDLALPTLIACTRW